MRFLISSVHAEPEKIRNAEALKRFVIMLAIE